MASLSASATLYYDEFDTGFTFSTEVPTGVRIDSITLKQTTSIAGSSKGTWTLTTGSSGTGTKIGTISNKSITDLKTTTTFTDDSYNTIRGLKTTYLHTTITASQSSTYTLTVNYTTNSTY